ncbi:MAG: permease-like cell division protein FtsX [Firmicutes bacterium]|nr:permease-like cell division protein FtsX [Bacillota bacterium]
MKLHSYGVAVRQGLQGIHRNRWMVVASVLTVSACLFILGIVYCIVINVQAIADELDDNLGIVAFLSENVSEDSIPTLKAQVEQMEGVKEVVYVSAEEAWQNFKESMGFSEQFGKDAIEQLDRDNPLANSASFQIYLYDAANQSAFVNHLKTLPQFRRIRYAAETAEVMANISRVITMGGLVLILLLVGIAILLISNTIKLSVYVRRNEVEIMKYIGATDAFVRTPFVVEGIIIGILGAILPALLIYFTYEALLALIVQQFTTSFSHMIHFMDTKSIMLGLAPIFLGVGIVVGVLGSLFSMQRYLKV